MTVDEQVPEQLRRLDLVEQQINRLQIIWQRILAQYQQALSQPPARSEVMTATSLIAEARDIVDTLPLLEELTVHLYLPSLDEIDTVKEEQSKVDRVNDNRNQLNAYAEAVRLTRRRVAGPSIRATLKHAKQLAQRLYDGLPPGESMDLWQTNRSDMQRLDQLASEIEALLGTSIGAPMRWGDLKRHISFGQSVDIYDVVNRDLPAIESSLQDRVGSQYLEPPTTAAGPRVPAVKGDVPDIVHAHIDWGRIDEGEFEELCKEVLGGLKGWTEVRKVTRTNAPDKGEDISAKMVAQEELSGTQDERKALVQCKHRRGSSVGWRDIDDPVSLQAWHGKLHYILVMTSGTVSGEARDLMRRWDEMRNLPQVRFVVGDELADYLKRKRPDLVDKYDLAGGTETE